MNTILEAIAKLDAIESDQRSFMDDDGIDAMVTLANARAEIRALIRDSDIFCCRSLTGGWQTAVKKTGYLFGPVFNSCTDLWNWQGINLFGSAK